MASERPLPPKQQAFVREYLIDLNATQAYVRAGFRESRASGACAHTMLKKPEIQAALSVAIAKRAQRVELTADRVLEETRRVAMSDIRKFFSDDGELRDIKSLSDEEAAALSSVEVLEGRKGFRRVKKIKTWDKLKALELLHRHLGLVEPTTVNVAVPVYMLPPGTKGVRPF